jgi:hypothetical protein
MITGEMIFGTVELKTDMKLEDGKLWLGGHSIHRDLEGKTIKVTRPTWNCYIITD